MLLPRYRKPSPAAGKFVSLITFMDFPVTRLYTGERNPSSNICYKIYEQSDRSHPS